MMVTVHLSDGRKITKDADKLIMFNNCLPTVDNIQEGRILLNVAHIVDMRPADEIERKHAEIHGL